MTLSHPIPYLDKGFRYAVEVRHRSWFQDLAYKFFRNHRMCIVWNQLAVSRCQGVLVEEKLFQLDGLEIFLTYLGEKSVLSFCEFGGKG
jgi:Protein of unknown function DUF72